MVSQETTILIAFTLVSIFILLITGYFFYRLHVHHKEYTILEKEKLNAEMNTIKNERLNIANELHNDIAPLLASIRFRLGAIDTKNKIDAEKCNEALSVCIEHIRGMVRNLAPIGLYDKTFQQAIKEYINNSLRAGSLIIDFREMEYVELEDKKNEFVYRIVQEIIENASKHSKAENMIIEVSMDENQLLIRTSDDGVGFEIDEVNASEKKGYGLLSIQNKIDFLKGSIAVKTGKNKGTKYNIRIPLADK